MKTTEFQHTILMDIKKALSQSALSMDQLAKIAEEAIALSEIYKNEIPREAVLKFMQTHQEINFSLKEDILREQQEADNFAAEEIRNQIKKRQS